MSFQNSDEICILRRSDCSLDLFSEHFVVRHSIFVQCPARFKIFDIAKRNDWIPSLGKRIVHSRQVIERADGLIVTIVEVRVSSLFHWVWFRIYESQHYVAHETITCFSSFLKESISLIRQCTVNFTNPNDMRAESQNAIIINGFIDDDFDKICGSLYMTFC